MAETNISFYLWNNRIHIFVEALRGIGCPHFVCFIIGANGDSLVLTPYTKKDFHSHRVPPSVYCGKKSLELTSIRLCKILSSAFHWNSGFSYRVPGIIVEQQKIVIFNLWEAKCIEK